MRRFLRTLIPSMYHRRLFLLGAVAMVLALVLFTQLARLTVAKADDYRAKAESMLVQRELVPTRRGDIFDVGGTPLANDRVVYEIQVRFPVINGTWQFRESRRAARHDNRNRWDELTEEQRSRLAGAYMPTFERQAANLWETLCKVEGIDPAELADRRASITNRVNRIRGIVLRERMAQHEVELSDEEITAPIGEQFAFHTLVSTRDIRKRDAILMAIDAARESDEASVWTQVHVHDARGRQYPSTTRTFRIVNGGSAANAGGDVIDTSTFPSPLRAQPIREVTVDGLLLHILGGLRDAWKEDIEARPFRKRLEDGTVQIDLGGYLDGDRVGSRGIEKTMEPFLRGLRGQRVHHLDTGVSVPTQPVEGQDVYLTIDLNLQARIRALMDPALGLMKSQPWHRGELNTQDPDYPYWVKAGEPLNGCAVVIEVATGNVLAAVSTPSYEPLPGKGVTRAEKDAYWANTPFLNRVAERAYQPGSTVKPMVLTWAIREGKLGIHEQLECTGYLDPNNREAMRCWIYKMYNQTHGHLTGEHAIQKSCNIFFYKLGRRLRGPGIVRGFRAFGLGRHTHGGVPDVAADLPRWHAGVTEDEPGFTYQDATFMGIGQGPVRWTALQAAAAYTALARGGRYINPNFIRDEGLFGRERIERDLGLPREGVDLALEGLYLSANERGGTTYYLSRLGRERIFNIEGVRVMAKSGTADAVPLRIDSDDDDRITGRDRIVRKGDHAWCIAIVQKEGQTMPRYVVAVVAEYAGSGGAVSGPLANQILHALRAEGRL